MWKIASCSNFLKKFAQYKNIENIGENIELLLQSISVISVVFERELHDTSTQPTTIIMLETRSENSSRCDRCKLSIYLRRCFVLLLGVDYLWKDISLMLNVSWCTVYSCELHLENVTGFNNISDDGLDQPIQHFSILNKYMELWLGNLLNWDIYEV